MNDRKLKILAAVVDEYIRTGEPVGSKAIASLINIKVSAATVRNDMAALEQAGYLEQPHTSAGRVPTFNGYRLYIDKLMTVESLSEEEKKRLDDMIDENEAVTEELLIQSASTALAEITKCAVAISTSAPKFSVITKVEVIPTGKRLYVILLITSSGNIKNKACRLEFDLDNQQLDFFSKYIEQNLQGISVDSISEKTMDELVAALGTYMVTLSPLVKGVYELSKDLRQHEVAFSGERHLLSYEELDKMEVVKFIENKDGVMSLLDDSFSGIHVVFSNETNSFVIGNSSMIVSKYRKGEKEIGSLGIIGPMRLNYSKLIPYLEYFTDKLTGIVSNDDSDKSGGKEDTGEHGR